MSRILIVDDEPAIRRLLSGMVARGGHEAVLAADGRSALAEIARGGIDAALVDLGLPDMDGLELIDKIRAGNTLPLVVVTARHEIEEKIAALDLGADDYVTKPFDGDELLARLRSALRRTRTSSRPEALLNGGPITMDVRRHRVTCRETPVPLTPREFSVLQVLLEADGRIVTHAALLERVWGKAHADDVDYLRVVIRALRLKLEADPSQPSLIRNEPAIGYRLTV